MISIAEPGLYSQAHDAKATAYSTVKPTLIRIAGHIKQVLINCLPAPYFSHSLMKVEQQLNFKMMKLITFLLAFCSVFPLSVAQNLDIVNDARITGKLGIGTNSPVQRLHLYDAGNSGDIKIGDSYPFVILNTTTGAGNAGIKFEDQGGYTGWISHNSGNDAIYISGENSAIAKPNLVVSNQGFVGVGTSTPAFPLHVAGGPLSIDGLEIENIGSSNLALDGDIVPRGGSSLAFDLGNNTTTEHWDDVVANDFVTFSDRSVKKEIEDLTVGLAELLTLHPVQYRYKSIISPDNQLRFGLIAQEVEHVIPNVIRDEDVDVDPESGEIIRSKSEVKAMNYMELIPVLIKAMQEQQHYIETLELRIEQLEK